VEFPKTVIATKLLTPPSFEEDVHSIEYREDPLTGVPCRISARRTARLAGAQAKPDTSEVTGREPGCAFCPENVDRATPRFAEGLYPEGRIRVGECYLFPNLFPLAEHHAAATLTSTHFLDLDQFEVRMIVDSLKATKEYLVALDRYGGEACHPIYLWNHLPPSAASMIHPHVQILVHRRASPYQQRLLDSSREYYSETGRSFWLDIVEEEKRRGERYIWASNSMAVIASFAPQGNREIQMIFRGSSNLLELIEQQMTDFARCLVKLLEGYSQMGVDSFNLSTFSAPLGQRLDYYSLHAKLISRPMFRPFYRNDTGILERFHYEADIEMMPEVVAEKMRAVFEGWR